MKNRVRRFLWALCALAMGLTINTGALYAGGGTGGCGFCSGEEECWLDPGEEDPCLMACGDTIGECHEESPECWDQWQGSFEAYIECGVVLED